MKKIYLYIIGLIGLFAVGCNPMADINDEIDKMSDDAYVKDTFIYNREIAPEAYTLVDEDYELSSNENVSKYKNFSDSDLPKDYLPEILNKKFTAADAFEMQVTYNYYSRPVPATDPYQIYTISDDEYSEMGQRYIGFDNEDAADDLIAKLLDRKIYVTESGTEQTVEYNEYVKSQIRFITINADKTTTVLDEDPGDAYVLTEADYTDLDEPYGNFTFIEDAEEGVVELAELRGHTLPKNYSVEVYRNFFPDLKVFYFNGANWMVKSSVMAVSEPLNYALNEDDITLSFWWADPAIKVTLGQADYDLFTETSKYQNFDLRSGSVPGTDHAKLIEMIGGMLDANHDPIDDQQYLVTYAFYDGASGTATIRMIRTAGVWAEFVESED